MCIYIIFINEFSTLLHQINSSTKWQIMFGRRLLTETLSHFKVIYHFFNILAWACSRRWVIKDFRDSQNGSVGIFLPILICLVLEYFLLLDTWSISSSSWDSTGHFGSISSFVSIGVTLLLNSSLSNFTPSLLRSPFGLCFQLKQEWGDVNSCVALFP